MKFSSCILVLFFFLTGFSLHGENYELLADLSPTHETKSFHQLKVVLKIPYDFGGKDFLVKPTSITADKEGNIFIYDSRQTVIYSFDKFGKPRMRLSGRGEGPGEMAAAMGMGGGYDIRKMNYCDNIGLLVSV